MYKSVGGGNNIGYSQSAQTYLEKRKDKPHILMLAREKNFPPARGAAASRLHSFAKYWSNLTEVTVITPQHTREKEGFRKICFHLIKQRFDFLRMPVNIIKLYNLTKGLNPDIVFVSIPTVWPSLEGYFLSKLLNVPLILDVRDLPASTYPKDEGFLLRRIFNLSMQCLSRYLIRKSSRIVSITDSVSDELKKNSPSTPSGIKVIRNGSELGIFKGSISARKEYDIVYSGTLLSTRDPQSILRYLRFLADLYPSLKVLFLSDINATSVGLAFSRGLEDLNLRDNVTIKEMLPHTLLGKALSSARLGMDSHKSAIYSERGAISAKDYEYLAAGLPVVGLLDPGFYVETKRLILDNDAGILYPDPESLARKTVDLLKDPARLRKMSKRAREVGMRFDRKRLAEEYYYNVILPAWREFNARQSISDF